MALEVYANQPSTTVSSGGTDAPASGTQEMWTVASSSSFPAASSSAGPPTQFHVADALASASSELIAVTNVSGTTWTVTRGAEGTTPVTHVAGFTIYQVVSAGAMEQAARVDWLNVVTVFSAVGDGKSATDGAISSSSATFTSASASFTAADAGKLIAVAGAGTAGAVLATTIASVTNATTVTLNTTAGTTVSGTAEYTYGTANDTAFADAVAAFPQPSQAADFPAVTGGGLYIPGIYCFASSLDWRINGLKVITDGEGATVLQLIGTDQPVVKLAGRFQDISGIIFSYSQIEPSANTASIVMQFGDDTLGSAFECNYHELTLRYGAYGMATNPALITTPGYFSCTWENIQVNGWSISALNMNANNSHGNANATGCVFDNIYCVNAITAGVQSCTAAPVLFKNWDELVINQLNIEHCTLPTSVALAISVTNNITINALHFEGLTCSGNNALISVNAAGTVNLNSVTVKFNTFSGASSNPVVSFSGSGVTNLKLYGFYESGNTITTPAHPFISYGSATNVQTVVSGVTTSQTTANTTTANAGCLAQFGIAPGGAGILPYAAGFTSFGTGGVTNVLNTTAGASTVMSSGTWFYSSLLIPYNVTLTGIIAATGNAGSADSWIVALWPGTGGSAIANSSLSGIAAPGANTKKQFPFGTTVSVTGPGAYIAGVQSNGNTAKLLTFNNAVEGFITGTTAGSFGTVPSLTPAGTYSASLGPQASTY